ncbi:MAG: phosphotyrosine protein phosphatase [Candidatus Woesebacteria bacterium]
MNVLFICSLNKIRSLTAEEIFAKVPSLHVRSAGTAHNARQVVNTQLLTWADIIFVMERHHQEKLKQKFPTETEKKRIIVLDIPNGFEYMDSELTEMIKNSTKLYL